MSVGVSVGVSGGRARTERPDPLLGELHVQPRRVHLGRKLQVGDVRGHGPLHRHAGHRREAVRERLHRVVVLLRADLDVGERDEPRGGEDAVLAHRAAERLPEAAGAADEREGAGDDGARGGAGALGEADGHAVRSGDQAVHGHAQGDGGVEDAGAVDVEGNVVLLADDAHRVGVLGREHAAAGLVVGVLQAHQAGDREVVVVRADRGFDLRLRCAKRTKENDETQRHIFSQRARGDAGGPRLPAAGAVRGFRGFIRSFPLLSQRASERSIVPSGRFGSTRGCTPPRVAVPPCSYTWMCAMLPTMYSLPRTWGTRGVRGRWGGVGE